MVDAVPRTLDAAPRTLPPGTPPNPARVVASAVRLYSRRTRDELARVVEAGDAAGVHDLRVALRRLLSALELAEALDASAGHGVVRRLERVLGSLSPLRDLEVERKTLDALAEHEPVLGPVAKELECRRSALARTLARKLARLDTSALESALELSAEALEREASAPEVVRLFVLAAVARRYAKFDARRRAVAGGDRHALHRVRIAFKRYRYAVEVALPLLPPNAGRGLATMKHFQDELGAIQDASVLVETLARFASFRSRKAHGHELLAEFKRDRRDRVECMVATLAAQVAADPPAFSEIFG